MSLWANFTDGIVNFNSIYFIVMSLFSPPFISELNNISELSVI